MLYMSQNIFC